MLEFHVEIHIVSVLSVDKVGSPLHAQKKDITKNKVTDNISLQNPPSPSLAFHKEKNFLDCQLIMYNVGMGPFEHKNTHVHVHVYTYITMFTYMYVHVHVCALCAYMYM